MPSEGVLAWEGRHLGQACASMFLTPVLWVLRLKLEGTEQTMVPEPRVVGVGVHLCSHLQR